MSRKTPKDTVDFSERVFDISGESMKYGAWLWWFWLFFFDNPKDPGKPRQLMILWSEKRVKSISCNGRGFEFKPWKGRIEEGVVAAWYFDGEEMHHNLLLEKCPFAMDAKSLVTESSTPTSFKVDPDKSTVRIGGRFEFALGGEPEHWFVKPTYARDNVIGDFGYSLLRCNRLDLSGIVDGEPVKGSAYFQRVFVNAPIPPWYWGIFHFENGGVLTYFRPHLLGKGIKGDIYFFDGRQLHVFSEVRVKRTGGEIPKFAVSGRNDSEELSFVVGAYAHSSWKFQSRKMGLFETNLIYNEYPAKITDLTLTRGGKRVAFRERLGDSVGNAEHTTGMLL